jgi:hypothetical protein
MSQLFNTGIIVSRGNSTNIPLATNTTFTGSTDDVTSYEEIDVNIAGSPSNAPGSLYFQFSPDGINWDVNIWVSGSELSGLINVVPQCLRVVLPYFRVIYTNGNIAQTEFRLTVVYHRTSGTRLTRYLNQPVDFSEPVENVQAFMAGRNVDGGFSHISLTAAGALQVDGSTIIQPTQITDGYNSYHVAVTPPNIPATAAESALVVAISPNNPITTSPPKPSTVTTVNVMASITNVTLLQPNMNRLGASIYNDSNCGFLYINLNVSADSSDFVIKLFPLSYYEVPFGYIGQINGAWSTTDGFARVAEFTP